MEDINVTAILFEEDKFLNFDVKLTDIESFEIINTPIYRKDGGFRIWHKTGRIHIRQNTVRNYPVEHFRVTYRHIVELKQLLKQEKIKFLTVEKYTNMRTKYDAKGNYVGQRRAVDWRYLVPFA